MQRKLDSADHDAFPNEAFSDGNAETEAASPPVKTLPIGERLSALLLKLAEIATAIRTATGWRRRFIAAGAGAASMLAMAPFYFWPVLFLTLPVAVALIDSETPPPSNRLRFLVKWLPRPELQSAAQAGWWFGFGYHFFGLFWIGEAFLVEADIFGWLLPFAITLMPAGLAVFSAASFAAARSVWPHGPARVISLAITVAICEYLRGHLFTGFPWNVLGYALTNDDVIMQSAGVFGIYGLTIFAVLICATPLIALTDRRTAGETASTASENRSACTSLHPALPITVLTLVPCLALYVYGFAVLPHGPLPVVPNVKIRIVQPSVPQHDKWARDKQGEIFNDHLILSRQNEDGIDDGARGITHIVWPEAAMPFLPLATPQALSAIAQILPDNTYLLAGALRLEQSQVGDEVRPSVKPKSDVYNSLLVFGPDGELVTLYDKIHLVPFGEYLPFTETLNSIGLEALTRIRGGFSIGPKPRPLLSIPGLPPVEPLICYEAIFPGEVVQGKERPSLLVNITNDGWFGNLTGPFQHFQQSRVRAVEEGLPMIRVANNGISALIDPYGRVVKSIGLNIRGVIDVKLPQPSAGTLYAKSLDFCFLVTIAISIAVALGLMACEKKRS